MTSHAGEARIAVEHTTLRRERGPYAVGVIFA